jgi:uncharacterized membrane protein YhaH (DUF805 family)
MDKSATQWMVEPIRKYASFSGRARRAEYWWFSLFLALGSFVLAILDSIVFGVATVADYGIGPLGGLFSLGLIIPSIAVSFRRLHDLDRSAWWLLLGLIPLIGALVLLFWYVQRGTVGDNRFGPDPLAGLD